jgi:biotin carboxyl carrier protein
MEFPNLGRSVMTSFDEYTASIQDRIYKIVKNDLDQYFINGKQQDVKIVPEGNIFQILIGKQNINLYIKKTGPTLFEIWIKSHVLQVKLEDHRTELINNNLSHVSKQEKSVVVYAPMPGLVIDVLVKQHAPVEKGSILVILEAMKMENKIDSKCIGFVKSVSVRKGDIVEKDQPLVTINNRNEI